MQSAATQVVHVVQSVPVQHICWQWATVAPPSVQLWKQDMLPAQAPSARQFSVSWQQLPTMHWLHGVPPGSSEQLPASMGLPQWPLSQVRPTQHSLGLVQLDPGGRQAPPPQTPFWQTLLQQSLGTMQEKPSIVHCPPPQNPPTQAAPQQSLD